MAMAENETARMSIFAREEKIIEKTLCMQPPAARKTDEKPS